MKKITICAAALSMMPVVSQAAGNIEMTGGFVDTVYVLSDGTPVGVADSQIQGRFVTDVEVDLEAKVNSKIKANVDVDLSSGNGGFARYEQAYVTYNLNKGQALKVGIMNNPLGWEANDAPGLYQITGSQLSAIWDMETANLDGNNIQGVLFAGDFDAVKLSAGLLSEIGDHGNVLTREEHSILVAVEADPIKDLNIKGGLVTSETSMETIIDVGATWKKNNMLLGGEVMLGSAYIDQAVSVTFNYGFTKEFSGTARFDMVDFELAGNDSTNSLTLAGLYELDKNLFVNAELKMNNDDNVANGNDPDGDGTNGFSGLDGDGTVIRLEMLATF